MNKAKVAGEKIENGDLVLVRQQATANDEDIVVALIDDEATIKRFARASGYFVLKPDCTSAEHRPIVVDRDFHIQGIVVRVLSEGLDNHRLGAVSADELHGGYRNGKEPKYGC